MGYSFQMERGKLLGGRESKHTLLASLASKLVSSSGSHNFLLPRGRGEDNRESCGASLLGNESSQVGVGFLERKEQKHKVVADGPHESLKHTILAPMHLHPIFLYKKE